MSNHNVGTGRAPIQSLYLEKEDQSTQGHFQKEESIGKLVETEP